MEIIMKIISWIISNWALVSGIAGPAIMLLISTIRSKNKIGKITADMDKWKQIGRMGLEYIDMRLAKDDPAVKANEVKELSAVQSQIGVKDDVNAELDIIRQERIDAAKNGKISIDAGVDLDGKGRFVPGIDISFTKLF